MNFARMLPLLGVAAVCVAAAPSLRAAEEIKLTAPQISALGVETVPLGAPQSAQLQGMPAQVVVPNDQLRVVSAPLDGLVERILVATQQQVARGQAVVRLQSPGLADIQHTFLQAATQLGLARTQLDRDESLFAEGIIAESRLQAARARWVEVSADYAERTQALRLAGMSDRAIDELRTGRRVGSFIELVAPIDGVVLEQLVVVGQRVDASAAILKIGRLDPLWLEIQVPLARLGGIGEGSLVNVPAADAEARVVVVGRNINATNQTVTVRAVTTRGAQRLRPGQALEVTLASAAAGGQWSVPRAALSRTGATAMVFVQTTAGFRAQEVRVVSESAEQTIVAGALKPGDRVAVKGLAALKAALAGIGVQ